MESRPEQPSETFRFLEAWRFIAWADGRMLRAARSVPSAAEYHRDRGISHGSVHALLRHMVQGQAGWLGTWAGREAVGLPDTSADALRELADIERVWPGVHAAGERYFGRLRQGELEREVRFVRGGKEIVLPLRETIAHMLDHCAYHRGQLNTLVTLAGGKRVWLSYWVYAMGRRPQASGAVEDDFLH